MARLVLLVLILCTAGTVRPATHWMVTEDGRIQTPADSLFNMVQAHDLVQFMRQEERVRKAESAQKDIDGQKTILSTVEAKDDPKMEEKLMVTDTDCIRSEKPLAQHDLRPTTILKLEDIGLDTEKYIGKPRNTARTELPHCDKYYDLAFSMYAFEHLSSMRARSVVSIAPEHVLISSFLDSAWPNTSDFGHIVAWGLHKDSSNWVLYNLAAVYWRILGKATEALECIRRALHFTPRKYVVLPLLSLANVLHLSSNSKDSAVVMDTLLAYNDTLPMAHCAAGYIYAVTGHHNRSILSFDICLANHPGFGNAKVHRAAVRCHQKLETALENQHENLQKTLSELQSYQNRLKTYQSLHETMLVNVADPETKRQMSLTYDYFTLGPMPHLNCRWDDDNGQQHLTCKADNYEEYKEVREKRLHQLLARKKSAMEGKTQKAKAKKESPASLTQPDTVDFEKEKAFLKALEPLKGLALSSPTAPRKYPMIDRSHLKREDFGFMEEGWPTKQQCYKELSVAMGKLVELTPHLFLSPENKGFEVWKILTKHLNIGEGEQHPLPWYPPFCTSMVPTNLNVPCCDHLLGVQRARKRDRELMSPEPELNQQLLALTFTPVDSEAEMGQRINTLLKYNIGPKWLVLNLAALYWRAVGITAEAVACLRLSLAESPDQYADVALVQLSQLAVTAGGRLDDGIVLAKQAVAADSMMPESHLLLAHYLVDKRNYTGVFYHLSKAMELDPMVPGGLRLLKALRCHQKFSDAMSTNQKNPKVEISSPSQCDESLTPRLFCVKPPGGNEHCYIEERKDRTLPNPNPKQLPFACQTPRCVPPPPVAAFLLTFMKGPQVFKSLQQGRARSVFCSTEVGNVDPVEAGPSCHIPVQRAMPRTCREAALLNGQEQDETMTRSDALPTRGRFEEDDDEDEEITLDHDNQKSTKIASESLPETPQGLRTVQYKQPAPPKKPQPELSEKENMRKVEEQLELLNTNGLDKDFRIADTTLPEILPLPFNYQLRDGQRLVPSLPLSAAECAQLEKRIKLDHATSTWLSVTAKGVRLDEFIDFSSPAPTELLEPICPEITTNTLWTMDHLKAFQLRHLIKEYVPEKGLKDAFQSLGGKKESLEAVATRLAQAIANSKANPNVNMPQDGGVHWSLTTVAALYWRVQGNASMAIVCLRHALNNAPYQMRDLALVSLANVYHQAGFLHSALITGGAAFQLSPRFVVIHFTIANIYAAMGRDYYEHAMLFYFSTLALQNNFDPARERIRALYCIIGKVPPQVNYRMTP